MTLYSKLSIITKDYNKNSKDYGYIEFIYLGTSDGRIVRPKHKAKLSIDKECLIVKEKFNEGMKIQIIPLNCISFVELEKKTPMQIEELKRKIRSRKEILTEQARKLFKESNDINRALESLLYYNKKHCNPPLLKEEIIEIIKSVYQNYYFGTHLK